MNSEASVKGGLVTYQREGHLGFITLNRPEKLNAIDLALWRSLGEAVSAAEKDTEARVILLRGAGKSFSAGLDLSPENEVIALITGQASASQKMTFYRALRELHKIHNDLEQLPQPTIAVVQGHCIGAGLELALCCDIRLCSADATFALPEARFAIITDVGGLQRLPRVVGPAYAREIAFRGHRFNAQRAAAIGLVNELYPDRETLEREAMAMASEIASNPPLAVQGAKEVMLMNQEVPADRGLDYNAARSSMIMPSEDLMEAITAYLQKRKGNFKGA
jgi:enoyl-CoA hydratase